MKRIFWYIGLTITLFILGFYVVSPSTFFELLNAPFSLIGSGLRYISLTNAFLNAIAVIIYFFILICPVIWLGYKVYHKSSKNYDIILLPLISLSIAITLFYAINPHQLIEHIDGQLLSVMNIEDKKTFEMIYLSGLSSIFYALISVYFVMFFHYSKKVKLKSIVVIGFDILAILFIIEYSMINLTETISYFQESNTFTEQFMVMIEFLKDGVLFILMLLLIVNIIPMVKDFSIENTTLQGQMMKCYHISLTYVLFALAIIVVQNGLIFIFRKELQDVRFQLDLPFVAFFLSLLLLLGTKYIYQSMKIKQENDLFV